MAEYGALTSGAIWTDLSGAISNVVEFFQTPEGMLSAAIFFLLVLFLSRNKNS